MLLLLSSLLGVDWRPAKPVVGSRVTPGTRSSSVPAVSTGGKNDGDADDGDRLVAGDAGDAVVDGDTDARGSAPRTSGARVSIDGTNDDGRLTTGDFLLYWSPGMLLGAADDVGRFCVVTAVAIAVCDGRSLVTAVGPEAPGPPGPPEPPDTLDELALEAALLWGVSETLGSTLKLPCDLMDASTLLKSACEAPFAAAAPAAADPAP